jgi:hypothetical protein
MFQVAIPLLLAAALAQPPVPAPAAALGGWPELKAGTMVRLTTGHDTVTGTIEDAGSTEMLRLRVPGTATPTFVRRSAIETVRVIPEARPARAAEATAVDLNRHLVYVHGICKHRAGFSKPWWAAMSAFTPQIAEANVHEVVWSDLVTGPAARAAVERSSAQAEEQRRLAESLRAVLRDRADQAEAEGGQGAAGPATPGGEPGHGVPAESGILGGITESIECAEDFVVYMTVTGIREQILGRFDQVVRPLLESGAEVEIISHSWGTVIAYEGLRRLLDPGSPGLRGTVHNLFTVGSALSIGPVKLNLAGRVAGGAKPQRVSRWVNIDAQFDIVGGHIQGVPFAVDVERLHLAPVGCSFPVTPTCAHGSYFVDQNVRVNRDIFGALIAQ